MKMRWYLSRSPASRLLLESIALAALFAVLASIFGLLQHALLPDRRPSYLPLSGMALAVFMVRGWGGLSVVGLGTLAFYAAQPLANHSLPVMATMTLGPTLQAAWAAWLTGRLGGLGAFATQASMARMRTMAPWRIGVYFGVLMLLMSTLAPGVAALTAWLSGDAGRAWSGADWQMDWLDSLGGMLAFGPLMYFAGLYWSKRTLPRDLPTFCLAGLIAGGGVSVFAAIQLSDRGEQTDMLLAYGVEVSTVHIGLMQAQISKLVALKAFMESSPDVTANGFDAFATSLLAIDPTLHAMSWIAKVTAIERLGFERHLQQLGQALFQITEAGPNGTQASRGDTFFPVTYIAPRLPYTQTIGMDMARDPLRMDLYARARDSGELAASAPLRLLHSDETLPAVLTALPVYRASMPLATMAQRQQAFRGVVCSSFEPNKRFASIRSALRPSSIEFFVFDLGSNSDETSAQLIAWSSPDVHALPPPNRDLASLRQDLHAEHRFSLAGRQRLMVLRPGANAGPSAHHMNAWLSLVFSGLLCATLLYFMGRRETQDQSLRQSNSSRQEEADFTRQLLEQLPIGVAVRNLQGDVLQANPAFCALLGRTLAQTVGMGNAQITVAECADLDAAQTQILERTGAYGPYEKEYLQMDGSRVQVMVRGIRAEWHGQTVILSVASDISARRKSEFRMAQSQKMDAIGQLTGGLAHDFNNMLGVIIGQLDLLSGSLKGNAAAQVKLEIALTAALRGADLTRALLAVARAQAIRTEPTDLNSRLQELLPLAQHTAGNAIEVRLTLVGQPVVEIDPGGLASTVLNLVLNARDAMPEGGQLTLATQLITIDANQTQTTLRPGQYAALSVSDTGCGMSAEVLARVLEPFFTTKERGRGTGLGLSMAHGFVQQCGGDLRIYSEAGHGTTVRLMLPIAVQPAQSATALTQVAAAANAPMPRGMERVLVVDDELELLAITATWLKDLGYEVTPCMSPASALAAMQDGVTSGHPYALLVTDITMPGMDGFALVGAARAIDPSLALIYTSGFADVASRGATRLAGAVLEKPFRQAALAALVRQTLDHPLEATA